MSQKRPTLCYETYPLNTNVPALLVKSSGSNEVCSETYISTKRDLQKRPVRHKRDLYVTKETYGILRDVPIEH